MDQKDLANISLESIITHIPHFVFWKDTNFNYLGCNDNFAKAVGLQDPQEIVGKTDYDLWETPDAHIYREEDKEIIHTGQSLQEKEIFLVDKKGKEIIILVSKVPLHDDNNDIVGILGFYTNITQQKKTEELLKEAKEKAELANHAKSDFLAVTSHELRLPLTAILGTARLLNLEENIGALPGELIENIIMSGEHLLVLINDMLDFAKFEAGKLKFHLAPVDLRKITCDVVGMLAHQAKLKNIKLLMDYAFGAPQFVISDEKILRQVLLNLAGNALKFTEHGHVIIKVNCLKQTKKGTVLVLSVEDTGIGIPANKLDMVFEKFCQVDSFRTRAYGGTGLGLTISKAYVEAIGGKISVHSQPGIGSLFSCTIPFKLASLDSQSPPEKMSIIPVAPLPIKQLLHILLVEDDLVIQKIHCKMFEILGCIVDTAINSKEALTKFKSNKKYDAIFMDIGLMGMNGYTVAAKMRQSEPEPYTPIIAMTGYNSEQDRKNCFAAGMNDVAIKPIALHDLEKLLRRWVKCEIHI